MLIGLQSFWKFNNQLSTSRYRVSPAYHGRTHHTLEIKVTGQDTGTFQFKKSFSTEKFYMLRNKFFSIFCTIKKKKKTVDLKSLSINSHVHVSSGTISINLFFPLRMGHTFLFPHMPQFFFLKTRCFECYNVETLEIWLILPLPWSCCCCLLWFLLV